MTKDDQTDTQIIKYSIWPLRVLRWFSFIPLIYYTLGAIVFGIAGLGTMGFSALTTVPIGSIWFMAFGQPSYDLFAVFWERKATIVLFDTPLIGEQIYWSWFQPSFNQSPVVWLGIAAAWAVFIVVLGFLLRRATAATDTSVD